MDVSIRLVTNDEDIENVHQTMLKAFGEYSKYGIPSSAINEKMSTIKKLIDDGMEQAILALEEGNALGSVRFKMYDQSLYFARLSVLPEARGNGIAKTMLRWLEGYGKINRKEILFCRVRLDSPKNIEFYRSIGFEIAKKETIINKDGNVVDTVIMEKVIKVLEKV
jgi:ribosomal protein S18 acetylase RimI-like enzyme